MDNDEILIPRIDMTKPAKSSDEMQHLKEAFDRVKEFPEMRANERALWLELRRAVEKVLERYG